MGIRRWWWWWWAALGRRRWSALTLVGASALVACALCVQVPARLDTQLEVAARAADLAHALADFSNQPHVSSWWVEEDRTNYTTWRYAVRYRCGARCAGSARVTAHDAHARGAAPQHGRGAAHHRVTVARRHCTALPLLPWPRFCEELETIAVVKGVEGGAHLMEESRTRCSVVATLTGACARWLRAQRDLRVARWRTPHHA